MVNMLSSSSCMLLFGGYVAMFICISMFECTVIIAGPNIFTTMEEVFRFFT